MGLIDFSKVTLTDGFWKYRYELNIKASIPNIISRFSERIEVMKNLSSDPNNLNHRYFDSDVAKLIEAIAYVLKKDRESNSEYEVLCDEIILNISKNQDECGYYNAYYQSFSLEEIFTKRGDHELYNLGHLIEAAIAYHDATGKDLLLNVVKKYLDYVEKRFVINQDTKFVTPGHEEIEIALLRLYEYTKESKYYDLASFFLEQRGNNTKDVSEVFGNSRYAQDNNPIRDLRSVEGHAVRAMYLFDAMAKYAFYNKDKNVIHALDKLYEDLLTKQYITGAIGSYRIGEIFTIPYDLPNLTAYSESCASIAEMMFLLDLYNINQKKQYHDQIERIMYNGFLSSTSLDGKAFFYENPLEIRRKDIGKETSVTDEWKQKLPIIERVELFDCSCCPPNIARTIATISKYIYYIKENEFIINQFISSKYEENDVKVEMISSYPESFKVNIKIEAPNDKLIKVRLPWYSKSPKIVVNQGLYKCISRGYMIFNVIDNVLDVSVDFNTNPVLISPNPKIVANQNKYALMYGPIVYCLEEIDNGINLNSLRIQNLKTFEIGYNNIYKMNEISVQGFRTIDVKCSYTEKLKYQKQHLKFIPYYCFANRGPNDMIVWINKK